MLFFLRTIDRVTNTLTQSTVHVIKLCVCVIDAVQSEFQKMKFSVAIAIA